MTQEQSGRARGFRFPPGTKIACEPGLMDIHNLRRGPFAALLPLLGAELGRYAVGFTRTFNDSEVFRDIVDGEHRMEARFLYRMASVLNAVRQAAEADPEVSSFRPDPTGLVPEFRWMSMSTEAQQRDSTGQPIGRPELIGPFAVLILGACYATRTGAKMIVMADIEAERFEHPTAAPVFPDFRLVFRRWGGYCQ